MAENTKIQWADHTFNPWMGCTKVAPGCKNCYAEGMMDSRLGKVEWGPTGTRVKTSISNWCLPLKWNQQAERDGARARVFCASLADILEDWPGLIVDSHGEPLAYCDGVFQPKGIPEFEPWRSATMDDLRREFFKLIDATPHLIWMLLTKRIENARRMWPKKSMAATAESWGKRGGYNAETHRENVWLYTSISDQETADRNLPLLMQCRDLVPVLGVSAEPLLGEVDLSPWMFSEDGFVSSPENGPVHRDDGGIGLGHVIAGGESGPGARSCTVGHVRSLVQQCKSASVPFFHKQLGANPVNREGESCPRTKHPKGGEPSEWPKDLRVREMPNA